jgi:hypothetical protein
MEKSAEIKERAAHFVRRKRRACKCCLQRAPESVFDSDYEDEYEWS